jgi:ferredoxin
MSLKPRRVLGPGLLRVQVDRERCQGHARCVAVASELFQLEWSAGTVRGPAHTAAAVWRELMDLPSSARRASAPRARYRF